MTYFSERQRRAYHRRRNDYIKEDTAITVETMDILRKLLDSISFGIVKIEENGTEDTEKTEEIDDDDNDSEDEISEDDNDVDDDDSNDSSLDEE